MNNLILCQNKFFSLYLLYIFVIFYVTGRNTATLFQLRQRSALRYEISPKMSKDVYEIVMYYANDGVHMDFVKTNDKKTVLISLNEEQANTWRFVRPMINNAVRKREEFTYELGNDVRASHEKFRKLFYVMVRQWYSDDKGDYQPSTYGVHIPHDVWHQYTAEKAEEIGEYYLLILYVEMSIVINICYKKMCHVYISHIRPLRHLYVVDITIYV